MLAVGRQKRSELYSLFIDPETPVFLAPRRRRLGVTERVAADGSVLTPLDEARLREAVRALVEEHKVEVIAVCYLFSFLHRARTAHAGDYPRDVSPSCRLALLRDRRDFSRA